MEPFDEFFVRREEGLSAGNEMMVIMRFILGLTNTGAENFGARYPWYKANPDIQAQVFLRGPLGDQGRKIGRSLGLSFYDDEDEDEG